MSAEVKSKSPRLAKSKLLSLACCLATLMVTSLAVVGAEPADAPTAVKHRVLICEYGSAARRLLEISPDGKLTWEHKFPSLAVVFRPTTADRIVFADGGSPTGIVEIDRDHKVIFDYRSKCEQILGCDVLPNGNFLIAEQGPCQAVEVDRQGKVVSTIQLHTTEKPAHRQLRCLHQLSNGNLLGAHEAEGVVREYDRTGKIVWEYANVPNVFEALRLPNGNTLIGCGTDKRVIEVTPEKKIVWELTAADAPELNLAWITGLQLLKNGNIVVSNFLRGQEGRGAHAFEVTHDKHKKIVWKFADHALVRSITMARVLDE